MERKILCVSYLPIKKKYKNKSAMSYGGRPKRVANLNARTATDSTFITIIISPKLKYVNTLRRFVFMKTFHRSRDHPRGFLMPKNP